ncbi:hypothetical protein DXB92_13130 [Ruminococcus sp. OM06-36AC]|nr:hypothetical protein DXB92_13130 [Ruminococcus sp. OM06-36AC]
MTEDFDTCCRSNNTACKSGGAVFSCSCTSFFPNESNSSPCSASHCFIC